MRRTGLKMRAQMRRLLGREDGAINLEFVIWFPLLMLWITGFVSLFEGYARRNEAAKAAYAISDVLTRETAVSDAKLDSYDQLHDLLIPGAQSATLRFSNIRFEDPDYTVLWSRGYGKLPLTDAEVPTEEIPTMLNFQTIVLTETSVTYAPVLRLGGAATRTFNFRVVSRPRNSIAIDYQ